ncbi:hypothetical protein GCM10011351_24520 [Paraliobacillus quinghaiensis]|uniref:DUF2207 domain-containing protein n=1 Tax=Paraliobacillus quinghaiensis TaxID=470815 RepID=A0A917TTG2_9BACI|nr:DUF2207 domain-containing protein [Paraliobacillus quinghaiensis]GGM37396.1 hypothetical protein GCM10011351_24520 [Paraliobacillus quinghaiensis]
MKKIDIFLFILPLIFILISCSNTDNTIHIDQVDIQAFIDTDGTIHVKELYKYSVNDTDRGTIRSTNPKVKNFKAYVAPYNLKNANIETTNLDPMKFTRLRDQYYIQFSTNNKSQHVIYSYDIVGAITKYNDTAYLHHSFLGETNNTELHNVTINLYLPSKQVKDDIYFYVHSRNKPLIQTTESFIRYSFDNLPKSQKNEFALIFPSSLLTDQAVNQAKDMKKKLLVSESSLAWRYENVEDNFNQIIPLIVIGIVVTLIAGIGIIYFHPNNRQKLKDREKLLTLIEKTDPIVVSYVNNKGKLIKEDIISGLFSLYQRGLIVITEVPSELNDGKTFRFTWKQNHTELGESELYIKRWLFREKDKLGSFFLLESIADSTDNIQYRSQKSKTNKYYHIKKWHEITTKQFSLSRLKGNYVPYFLYSFSTISITLGLLAYFTFTEAWTRDVQFVIMIVFSILGAITLVLRCNKKLMILLFSATFILSIFLTMTTATVLFLLFILINSSLSYIIPSITWNKNTNEIQKAIRIVKKQFKTNQFPMGNTPKRLQNQLQLSLILDQEYYFIKACKPIPSTLLKNGNYPLLNNLKNTVSQFETTFYDKL